MSLDQQLGQILWEAYEDGCRRCEADLWRFVGPLNDWVRALFERRLPADWRDRLGAYLDGWEPEGFEVAPDQRQILEDWIEDWARYRGLLPEAAKEVTAEPGDRTAPTQSDAADQPFVVSVMPNASGPPESRSASRTSPLVGRPGANLDPETGPQYNQEGNRDGATGEWLSEDPIGLAAGDANLPRHVVNRAKQLTNPWGTVSHDPGAPVWGPGILEYKVDWTNFKLDKKYSFDVIVVQMIDVHVGLSNVLNSAGNVVSATPFVKYL